MIIFVVGLIGTICFYQLIHNYLYVQKFIDARRNISNDP
jgi:hypothetical protein